MSTETSGHFGHLLQVEKKNLWSLIIYKFFFHDFIYVWQPLGDDIFTSTGTSFHFGHLLQVVNKSLWSVILYIFFMILYMYIAPRLEADSPQGTKFWCQQKCLVTSFICCKFQKHVFEVWFYTFLAHLSRRLTRWAYSIAMVRRPSVVVRRRRRPSSVVRRRRRPHFQTCISLKPAGQPRSNFMCSITGVGEMLHKVLGQVRSKLWFPWQQKAPIDL